MSASRYESCSVCARRIRKGRMQRHVEKECKGKTHCSFCARPSVHAIFERLRSGEVPDLVASALQLTVEYVQETRSKGRGRGCLPRPTPEEVKAEREQTGLIRHGRRECSQCFREFIPKPNHAEQTTCGRVKCMEKRRAQLESERSDMEPETDPIEDAKIAAQMAPRQKWEAEIAAEANAQGQRILDMLPRTYALWSDLLEVPL